MSKISVTGPKKHLESVIEELYELAILDINQYDGELGTGEPSEESEELSELLVDVRSLISKLPEVGTEKETITIEEMQEALPDISEKIDELRAEEEELERRKEYLTDNRKFFKRLKGAGLKFRDLESSDALNVWVGKLDKKKFEKNVITDRFEIFEGESASAVIYSAKKSEEVEKAVQDSAKDQYRVPETDFEKRKSVDRIYDEINSEKERIEQDIQEIAEEKKDLAEKWLGKLNYVEEFLTEKVEKAEAPLKFATTEHAFIAQGWIPSKEYDKLEERLAEASKGKIHIQEEETEAEEEPPVKQDNYRKIEPFESLNNLMSVPKYNEFDPTQIIFITFPIFFGFMIGDIGYGLLSIGLFYYLMKKFPRAELFMKSMMISSVSAVIFGLVFGEVFGYQAFSSGNIVSQLTGSGALNSIPIIFERKTNLGLVLYASTVIGLLHVNLGYLIGFYNRYTNESFFEALFAKGGWFTLQLGIVLMLSDFVFGLMIAIASSYILYRGNGVKGPIMIPTLITRILSYLRIGGVIVAGAALTTILMRITTPMLGSNSVIMTLTGVMVLLAGHAFITSVKILQAFLQGIRLHYAEMFGTFYEGGGIKYAPFGAKNLRR